MDIVQLLIDRLKRDKISNELNRDSIRHCLLFYDLSEDQIWDLINYYYDKKKMHLYYKMKYWIAYSVITEKCLFYTLIKYPCIKHVLSGEYNQLSLLTNDQIEYCVQHRLIPYSHILVKTKPQLQSILINHLSKTQYWVKSNIIKKHLVKNIVSFDISYFITYNNLIDEYNVKYLQHSINYCSVSVLLSLLYSKTMDLIDGSMLITIINNIYQCPSLYILLKSYILSQRAYLDKDKVLAVNTHRLSILQYQLLTDECDPINNIQPKYVYQPYNQGTIKFMYMINSQYPIRNDILKYYINKDKSETIPLEVRINDLYLNCD